MSDTTSGIKSAFGSGRPRMVLIAVAIGMLFVGGISYLLITKQTTPMQQPGAAAVVPAPQVRTDITAQTPEPYKNLIREDDVKRSNTAKPLESVMPSVAGLSEVPANPTEDQPRKTVAPVQPTTPAPVPVDPAVALRQTKEYTSAETILSAMTSQLRGGANGAGKGWSVITPQADAGARAAGAGTGATGATNSGGTAAGSQSVRPTPVPIIRMGEILFSTTDITVNTDYAGPVMATIRQGKYAGARVMGQKTLMREGIVMKFTLLSPADGTASIPIKAYAVTLGDARSFGLTGIEGETNHHVFERYVLPAALAFGQTYGLAASQQGSTAVSTNGGVGTTVNPLSDQDRLIVAAGGALGPLLRDVTQASQRPITVVLAANTEIGLMFEEDVTSATIAAGQAAVAAGGAIPQQSQVTPVAPPVLAPVYQAPPQGNMGYSMQQQPGVTGGMNATNYPAYRN